MKKDIPILLLLILPAFSLLFQKGYFAMHDDLQTTRQLEMAKCFNDAQIPCRWVLDMGYGYGYPLFNYYPPLPYYLGQPFHLAGFSYIDIVKIVGIIGFVFTALMMYLLGREFWGRLGGLISAAFYTYGPYHSVDFWVRGAMNEFWAMAFYPAILYSSYQLIKSTSIKSNPSPESGEGIGVRSGGKWLLLLSLSIAGLMLSHNPMLMIFFPTAVIWVLFWWRKTRSKTAPIYLSLSGILALGLAAFFTLPVLFEQKFAHVETLTIGYFNYLAHYVPLSRMFLNVKWGYGASGLGQTDFLSFNIGYLQWVVPALVFIFAIFSKKLRPQFLLLLLLLLFSLGSLFMMHNKSTFIWQHFDPLKYLQFPWRFLSMATFYASFLSGAIALALSPKVSKILISILLPTVVLLNANYFKPRVWYPDMTDAQKFSGHSWYLLITSGIFDYLPIYAPHPPADPPGGDLNITPLGFYKTITKKTNFQEFSLKLPTTGTVEIQTYYFPGWQVWLDGKPQTIDPERDSLLGRMKIDVPAGNHTLVAKFTNTPIRTFGNILSAISWSLILFFGVIRLSNKLLYHFRRCFRFE
jgi:hypothetical protein